MSNFVHKVLNDLKPRHDDDFVDRSNYFYTALMFGLCAVTIASKQYVGQPIQCWMPPQFKGSMEKYVEDYCFIENTYFVHMNKDFPDLQAEREKLELGYYQWIPLLLVAQMVACVLPKVLYTSFNIQAGYSIEKMVDTVNLIEEDKQERKFKFKDDHVRKSRQTTAYLAEVFNLRRAKIHQAPKNSFRPIKAIFYKSGNTKLYLLYKLINLLNTMGQIYLLNRYLWPKYDFYGYGFLQDLINDHQWKESGEFPRVTFCDIEVREIATKPLMYTVQCVLMINMFNEKIYIFIWFWLLLLSALNALNLVYWFLNTHLNCSLVAFVRRNLSYTQGDPDEEDPIEDEEIDYFVNNFLYMDGVTTLRLLEANAGELVTSDMLKNLWLNFKANKPKSHGNTQLGIQNTAADEDPNMDMSGYSTLNQMTQSTSTDSTTTSTVDFPRDYTNNSTLRAAHQRVSNDNEEFTRQRNSANYPLTEV